MVETDRQVIIKLSGKESKILKALRKIEEAFPLHVKSNLKANDDGDGCHIFVTVFPEED